MPTLCSTGRHSLPFKALCYTSTLNIVWNKGQFVPHMQRHAEIRETLENDLTESMAWETARTWDFSLCRGVSGFPGSSVVKTLPADAGDLGSILGSGRSPGEGNGNPFQYSCLENSIDGGASQLWSMGSQRVGHDWNDWAHIHAQRDAIVGFWGKVGHVHLYFQRITLLLCRDWTVRSRGKLYGGKTAVRKLLKYASQW